MYSDVFCKVYNEFGWNYYPEAFGQQLLLWREESAPGIASARTWAAVPGCCAASSMRAVFGSGAWTSLPE